MAVDYSFIGAVAGVAVAILGFIGLMGLSIQIDRKVDTESGSRTACLLRLIAFLLAALSTGIGYGIGRALGS